MRSRRLMLLPLAAMLISMPGCATAPISSPSPVNACDSVVLPPRLTDSQRTQFLAEEAALPPGGVVRGVLKGAARVENDLRACQAVRP
jgi:hypothetical protein